MANMRDGQVDRVAGAIRVLDNRMAEMQKDVSNIKREIRRGAMTSRRQGIQSLGVAGISAGMTLSIAAEEYVRVGLFLFAAGLLLFMLSLFLRRPGHDEGARNG